MNTLAENAAVLPVNTPVRILVVSDFLPRDEHDDGPWVLQILRAWRELGHQIVFVARDATNREVVGPLLHELGIQVYAGDDERLRALGYEAPGEGEFAKVLSENEFQLAILVHSFRGKITVPEHYLAAIRKQSPKTRIAVLTKHIYGKLVAQQAALSQKHDHYEVAQDYTEREPEAFRQADLVIVHHEGMAESLRLQNSSLDIVVVPSEWPASQTGRGWKKRKGILFAPDFQRQGDVDGFVWFLQNVWTAISREARDIEVLICGGDEVPASSRQQLPQVRWLQPDNLQRLFGSARVFVSPLRFGLSKISPLLMLANGLPGVATTFVAECEGLSSGFGLLTADTPEDFARAVLRIHRSQQTWKELSESGVNFVHQNYSGEALKRQLTGIVESLGRPSLQPSTDSAFSMTLVDNLFREQLLGAPAERRIGLRLDAHAQLAEHLLRAGNPHAARRQLRHMYSWLGESLRPGPPLARLLSLLARCYRELGDRPMAARCGAEARLCFPVQIPATNQPVARVSSPIRPDAPRISLVVPTYNRLAILKKCLVALEAQTAAPEQFEVIVVDDGSSDGTEEMMRDYHPPFRFQYLRQKNSGTGAARRNAVDHAAGEYLLLMNDDTICAPEVVEEHLRVHQTYSNERWAVLGNFEYPAEARRRAMSYFLRRKAFMFPQVEMEEGFPYPYSYFITCNLSVRRDAVLQAGSFDSTYKLSEDTELGIRLFEMGYGVLYHPAAHAWHDHLPYACGNLIRRAKVYGADYFYMFRQHPRVIREWAMPLDLAGPPQEVASRITAYLNKNRRDVEAAVAVLEKWDNVEFEPLLADPREAESVLSLFQQAVPAIHWFYLLDTMLQTMTRELKFSHPPLPAGIAMAFGAGRK